MDILRKKGQSSLELSLAVVFLFVFFLGSFHIFYWLNRRLAFRQQDYEVNQTYGRVAAGSPDSKTVVLPREIGGKDEEETKKRYAPLDANPYKSY